MPTQDGTLQSSYSQNFQTGINVNATSLGKPDFAHQKYFDDTNSVWRAFRNLTEAHNWTTPKLGQLRYVRTGYTSLNTDGTYTGGIDTLYIYLGGTAVSNLTQFILGSGTPSTKIYPVQAQATSSNQSTITPLVDITGSSPWQHDINLGRTPLEPVTDFTIQGASYQLSSAIQTMVTSGMRLFGWYNTQFVEPLPAPVNNMFSYTFPFNLS